MYADVNLFIDGAWKPAVSGKTLPVLNPATGEPIGTVAHAERADLDLALAAAGKGFAAWRKVSAHERYRLMRKAAEILRGRANDIATIGLLADAARSFAEHCVEGITPNRARIAEHLEKSLMLVTALAPVIGYDRAAEIAKAAHANGTTLREEAVRLGHVTAEQFDALVRPERMTGPEIPPR